MMQPVSIILDTAWKEIFKNKNIINSYLQDNGYERFSTT